MADFAPAAALQNGFSTYKLSLAKKTNNSEKDKKPKIFFSFIFCNEQSFDKSIKYYLSWVMLTAFCDAPIAKTNVM
jgi:hypothetical protein